MKKFSVPTMTIQKLEDEDVMRTSGGCFEINACVGTLYKIRMQMIRTKQKE